MADETRRSIWSIAAHRGFADALVAGLVPRYTDSELGLARLTLLLPSRRAARTVTEAFVRLSGGGLLLPRMAVVGDLDLDEALGPLLDPLMAGAEIPPAVDPTRRWLRLAQILGEVIDKPTPVLLRLANEFGRTMDRLAIEDIGLDGLLDDRVVGIVGEQADHWRESVEKFSIALVKWRAELDAAGEVDPPVRRNLLFDHAAQSWAAAPPPHGVVAAGVTSASPALARLLAVLAKLPRCGVILPDLDLGLDAGVWDALGSAGVPAAPDDPPFGAVDAVTHPQYHLKLLLNRMGINRAEVRPWHRAGMAPSPPERSRAISNLFLPPAASAGWVSLPASERRLAGVRLMETAHSGEEAQAIALLVREALEVPGRRVAVVTPDRALAARVVAHLSRWGIAADDTAGAPLSQTRAGRLFHLLAEVAASEAAPVPLLALLGHPLVMPGEGRREWLEHVRTLDRALRGPRQGPDLDGLDAVVAPLASAVPLFADWWANVVAMLAPVLALGDDTALHQALDALVQAAEALTLGGIWAGADGRALSAFVDDLRGPQVETRLGAADLAPVLGEAMARVAVRPPWGGHPRVTLYGLLEARGSRADLVICGGLTEGVWPAAPAPDALLPPAVLRALGVPGADFRIGLSAHDLAAALGAPEVVLSWARRDASGPAIPSRFVLRVKALLGDDLLAAHEEARIVALAREIDRPRDTAPAHPQPHPRPTAEQRDVPIAVTALDRLRGDPYQFYASEILRLKKLDALDAEPTAAWKGTAVHRILETWHNSGGALRPIAEAELAKMSAHPLVRGLWWPRLVAGLDWIEAEAARMAAEDGRRVLSAEAAGHATWKGVKVKGRADRIDRLADGSLAIVDYKTGDPPKAKAVQDGFALQLGLIGLMAQNGAFAGVAGDASAFEYWTLHKVTKTDSFGEVVTPLKVGAKRTGIAPDDFLPETERFLIEAIDQWILGDHPFTARLNPDLKVYNDYDQLMRLDEWQARQDEETGA